jgi:hypothetical protein
MQSACSVLYCHLWPDWLYHIFPHYLINDTIFGGGGGGVTDHKVCFFFLCKNLYEKFNMLKKIKFFIT